MAARSGLGRLNLRFKGGTIQGVEKIVGTLAGGHGVKGFTTTDTTPAEEHAGQADTTERKENSVGTLERWHVDRGARRALKVAGIAV